MKPKIYIDTSAIPEEANALMIKTRLTFHDLAKWAKDHGYAVRQDGTGRVYFEDAKA